MITENHKIGFISLYMSNINHSTKFNTIKLTAKHYCEYRNLVRKIQNNYFVEEQDISMLGLYLRRFAHKKSIVKRLLKLHCLGKSQMFLNPPENVIVFYVIAHSRKWDTLLDQVTEYESMTHVSLNKEMTTWLLNTDWVSPREMTLEEFQYQIALGSITTTIPILPTKQCPGFQSLSEEY